jgi:outer membrane immunogenic protein
MNLVTRISLPLIACGVFASPAMAQDEVNPFTGFYVSGTVGAGFRGDNQSDTVAFDTNRDGTFNDSVFTSTGTNAFSPGFCSGFTTSNAPGNCDKDGNGIEYSSRIGFDAQMGGSVVIGGLLEVSKNDATDGTSAFSTTPAGYSFSRKLDNAISARARIGFTPGGKFLVYATGGASYARIKHGFSTTNTANSFAPVNEGDRVWGYQLGGGAEVMLARNISLGAEYLYSRYNDDKYFVAVGAGTASPTNPFLLNGGGTNFRPANTDFALHAVRATLSYHF